MEPALVYVKPSLQTYDWGVRGRSSLVGRMWERFQMKCQHRMGVGFFECQEKDDKNTKPSNGLLCEDTTYAELWFGAHPNGLNDVLFPSPCASEPRDSSQRSGFTVQPIDQYLKTNPRFQCKHPHTPALPYLLKLLSNAKALSLQCHPDKTHAERLYNQNPQVYRDPNDKPEISLALSDPVEALCGFRRWEDIQLALRTVPPLRRLVGEAFLTDTEHRVKQLPQSEATEASIKALFLRLSTMQYEDGEQEIETLVASAEDPSFVSQLPPAVRDALRVCVLLHAQHPRDLGCLAAFYLNYVVTRPGQCLFTKPNVLHAYIKGQIIECMACSDNVIRGGLTSKPKDVSLLSEVLDFSPYETSLLSPTLVPVLCTPDTPPIVVVQYNPPVESFCIYLVYVPPGGRLQAPISFSKPSAVSESAPATFVVLKGSTEITLILDAMEETPPLSSSASSLSSVAAPETIGPGDAVLVPAGTRLLLTNRADAVGGGRSVAEKPILQSTENDWRVPIPIVFDEILNGVATGGCLAVVATGRY